MPVWGTGPRRPDGGTNNVINATPTFLLPTQVSNLAVWFDAADTSTITTNISSLSQWRSKTPITYTLSNAFGLPGPTWISTTQNSLPVVRFRGANSSLMSTTLWYNTSNYVTNNEITLFLAYNPTNNGAPFGIQDSEYGNNLRIFPQSGSQFFSGNIYNLPNNARLDYSYPVGTGFKVETYFGRQSTLGVRLSGSLFAASTMGTGLAFPSGTDKFIFMGAQSYNSRLFTQDIGEALIYNRGLSDPEIQGIEAYLARKWGVQNSLPFRHPGRPSQALAGYRLLTYNRLAASNAALWFDSMDTASMRGLRTQQFPPSNLDFCDFFIDKANGCNAITIRWPVFDLFGWNYYPTLKFIANNPNNARFPGSPPPYLGSSLSMFLTVNAINTPFGSNIITIGEDQGTPESRGLSIYFNRTSTIGINRGGNLVSSFYINGSNILVSAFVNGTTSTIGGLPPSTTSLFFNGSLVASTTNPSTLSSFNMINYCLGGVNNFQNIEGNISEWSVFYRTLNTSERNAMHSQMLSKWQLPSNVPVTYINSNPVTNGLYLAVDAYDPNFISTTVTSDGLTRVDTAFDRSGNSRNFKVVTGFSNVFYNRVSTMNQFNSLYFSTGTTAGILSNINPVNTFSTNSYSLFLVYNQLSTSANAARVFSAANQTFSDVGLGGFSYQILGGINNATFFTPFDYQYAGANISNSRNYVYSLINNGGPTFDIYQTSTFYSYLNLGTGATLFSNINNASTNLLNVSQFNIGGFPIGTPFCFNGLISEVLLYNRALLSSERTLIENYLLNKWGISNIISNVPVTSGLNLWLDAYDPATVLFSTNTNLVTQWRDKSVSSLHMSNPGTSGGARMPLYTTTSPNGLPSLLFSNSAPTNTFATGLWNTNFTYPQTAEATLFVTYSSIANSAFYGPLFTMLLNNELYYSRANGFGLNVNNNNGSISIVRSSINIYSSGIANGHNITTLASVVFNSSFTNIPDIPQNSFGIARNGVVGFRQPSSFISTLGSLTAQNFLVNQASLGMRGVGFVGDPQWVYSGFIHEVLLYNRALSFVERQQVESYLLSKWNI